MACSYFEFGKKHSYSDFRNCNKLLRKYIHLTISVYFVNLCIKTRHFKRIVVKLLQNWSIYIVYIIIYLGVIIMTVGAVNGVYQYTGSYESQFFSGTVSSDKLNALMKEYGIQQTGDEYADTKALFQAMYNYFSRFGIPTTEDKPSQVQLAMNAPWAPLMSQVGLTATGELNKDYSSFLNKIDSLQGATSTSPSEKASLKELEQTAPYVFVQPPEQGLKTSSQNSELTGADILAQMNRAFLLG